MCFTAGCRECLEVAGFFDKVSTTHLFPSIHDAVIMALKANEQLRRKVCIIHENE